MIQIMRWEKHQHYKNRRYPPLWIKVFPKLLDDPLFMRLSESAQLLLMKLWLITSQAKKDGALPLNILDIAWKLRMEEVDTYPLVMELAEVKDEDGKPQWLEWTETPLDAVLKQRLDHECVGSRPSLDVEEIDEGEIQHQKLLNESRTPPPDNGNEVGLDLSHRDSNKNENEMVPAEEIPTDDDDDEEEVVEDKQDTQSIPESIPVSHGTWLTDYATPYEARFGAGSFPFGRAARALKQLEMHHGRPVVMQHWRFYCEVEPAQYANPQTFASKFNEYDPDNQTPSSLTPA